MIYFEGKVEQGKAERTQISTTMTGRVLRPLFICCSGFVGEIAVLSVVSSTPNAHVTDTSTSLSSSSSRKKTVLGDLHETHLQWYKNLKRLLVELSSSTSMTKRSVADTTSSAVSREHVDVDEQNSMSMDMPPASHPDRLSLLPPRTHYGHPIRDANFHRTDSTRNINNVPDECLLSRPGATHMYLLNDVQQRESFFQELVPHLLDPVEIYSMGNKKPNNNISRTEQEDLLEKLSAASEKAPYTFQNRDLVTHNYLWHLSQGFEFRTKDDAKSDGDEWRWRALFRRLGRSTGSKIALCGVGVSMDPKIKAEQESREIRADSTRVTDRLQ